jgi:lipoate-protein ligase B
VTKVKDQRDTAPPRTAVCLEFSLMPYPEAWDLQSKLVDARNTGDIDKDLFLVLEHPPVYTLGRRGGIENLTVPKEIVENAGIPIVHVERGGSITFHGPGQLVIYPIVDLRAARTGIVDFVHDLEEIMIRTAAEWGVPAERNQLNRGVWVGRNKMGSVGIAVRRGISFHGLALNVNTSLTPFEWINPCGLKGIGVTAMANESPQKVPMDQVRRAVKKHIESIFGIKLVKRSLSDVAPRIMFFEKKYKIGV